MNNMDIENNKQKIRQKRPRIKRPRIKRPVFSTKDEINNSNNKIKFDKK
jgi:hypothetical protein